MLNKSCLDEIYKRCMPFVTYVPAVGYVYQDLSGEWNGPYRTHDIAIKKLMEYLLETYDATGE